MKIETADAAQRLATAILADIRLYNAEAIAKGEDLTEVLTEARALYQSRVVPQWHSLFEQTIGSAGLTSRPFTTQPSQSSQSSEATTPSTTSSFTNLAWLAFGALGLGATLAWQLLR